MSWIEIILIGAGLSLDVFAYALCRGAVVGEVDKKSLVILGGGFTLWNLISLTAGNFVAKIPVVSKNVEYAANDWIYRLRFFLDWAFISSSKRQEEKK